MHPIARVFFTVWLFVQIFLGWVVIWIVQSLTKLVTFPFTTATQRQDICGHIFRRVSFVCADVLNPFWRCHVLRPFPHDRLPKDAKVIVVLNHLSNADPWMAIRPILPMDCKWICKGSLFSVPFGGWGLKNSGDLAIQFTTEKDGWGTKKGSVGKLMEDAKQLLDRRQPLAVFPEGIRNLKPEGPLGEFKPGFFKLAVDEGAIIVPIAVSGTEHAWSRKDWKFDSADCYFTCGEPIDSAGHTPESLLAKTFEVISTMRDAHPDRKKVA